MKVKYFISSLLITTFISCGTDTQNNTTVKNELEKPKIDTVSSTDTLELKETYNEEDIVVNEYLTERLKPIRQNFKRINSIANWTSTNKKDLWESSEGGQVTFYYLRGILEKIVTRYFGETGQILTEYYLYNGQLSFVFEKSYKYNRPIYWDSTRMNENNDNQTYDFEQSEIQEDRSYFENGKLIHKLESGDCGAPFAKDYLIEERKE